MKLLMCLVTVLCCMSLYAQNISFPSEESKLLTFYNVMQTQRSNAELFDSLDNVFINKTSKLLRVAGSAEYTFPRLKKAGLNIFISSDHRIHIWNWDIQTMGHMMQYVQLTQYVSTEGHLKTTANNMSYKLDSVVTVRKDLYLLFQKGSASSVAGGSIIGNLIIDGDSAIFDRKIFQKDTDLTSEILLGFVPDPRVLNIKSSYAHSKNTLSYTNIDSLETTLKFDGKIFRRIISQSK